jgi:hypothetical protein
MISFKSHKKYGAVWVRELEAGACWTFTSTNPSSRQDILRKTWWDISENAQQPSCGVLPVSIKSYDSRKNATQRDMELLDSPSVMLQYVTWQLIKSLQTCYNLLPCLNDLQFAILVLLCRTDAPLAPPCLQQFLAMHLSSCDWCADISLGACQVDPS